MRLFMIFMTTCLLTLSGCASLDKADSLYHQGDKEAALEMASQFLDSDNPQERARALKLLGKIGTPQAGKMAAPLLQDSNLNVQIEAVLTIGKTQYVAATQTLIELIENANGELKEALAMAFQQLGEPAIESIMNEFNAFRGKNKRAEYKAMLIAIGPAVSSFVTQALEGKSFFENQDHFDILVSIRSPRVAKAMLPYLENEEVAMLVVEGLGKLGSVAVDAVIEALKTPAAQDNALLRERLVKVLGNIKDPRAIPTLESLSQDPNQLVRASADHALLQIRGF